MTLFCAIFEVNSTVSVNCGIYCGILAKKKTSFFEKNEQNLVLLFDNNV